MTIELNKQTIGRTVLATGLLFFAGYGVGNIAAKIVMLIGG
ncbi:hypothetical protein AAG596_00360 [Citromicrobium bathyomarinum]|jgi:hypothetical protein|nr:hypothetical protein [Citromicrobium sp. JLT1363]|tara:strand:+ start:349 stop:471 length:123 start_codon:yes stop_codon:yes gene_type:complete